MKRHALFIGTDGYEDAQISNLVCAEADAIELHGFFKHRIGYELAEFLLAPSAAQILDAVARVVAPLGPEDIFLFYFAGHGVTHERRDLLLSAKARQSRLSYLQEVIPMDLLLNETARPGLNRVFVVDACRSNLLVDRQAGAVGFAGLAVTRDIVARTGDMDAKKTGSLALICSCEKGCQAGEIPERRAGVFRLAFQQVLAATHQDGNDATMSDELFVGVAQEMDRLAAEHQLPRRQRPSRELMVGAPVALFSASKPKRELPALLASLPSGSSGQTVSPNEIALPPSHESVDAPKEIHVLGTGAVEPHDVPDAEAARRYRKAAEQGDATAQRKLGNCYYHGTGVEIDETAAVTWYRRAAEQGDAAAQGCLGSCYGNGTGVQRDDVAAVKWLRKAAEQGNATAQCNLGAAYESSIGVEKDETEAVKWYRKAAKQGDATAQFNLGACYANGTGVEKDETEAVKWYRKAAIQGDADAQLNLGRCYDNGVGVTKDKTEAVKWYRKAAKQGDATAQCILGSCYEEGVGVEKDEAEAVKWYRKAAIQGFADAQFLLGLCFAEGRGVTKDKTEAVKWYRKAADQGFHPAVEKLKPGFWKLW